MRPRENLPNSICGGKKDLGSNRRRERASFSKGMMKEKREELKEGKHQGRQEAAAMERERSGGVVGGGRGAGAKEPPRREVFARVCVRVRACMQSKRL